MTNRKKNDIGHGEMYRGKARRAAAVLLALGLCAAGVCAAAEDNTVPELQTEFPAQTVEASGTAQADMQQAADGEQTAADMGDMTEEGIAEENIADVPVIFAEEEGSIQTTAETVSGDMEGIAGETVPEDMESNIEEMLPEDAESTAGEIAPEISVESIQVDDSGVYDGDELTDGEAEAEGKELPEDGTADSEKPQTEDGAEESELSGECGAQPGTVYWSLDETGILTITGNGPMADWESVEQAPWFSSLAELRAVVIMEGVTSVGAHAFSGAQAVESVELAESIECVGAFAFFQCGGLGSVTIG